MPQLDADMSDRDQIVRLSVAMDDLRAQCRANAEVAKQRLARVVVRAESAEQREQAAREENEKLRALLIEALDEYADHSSWRCEHPPHYYLAGGPPDDGDCACGFVKFEERARNALDSVATEERA